MPHWSRRLEQTVLGWLPVPWQVRLRRAHAGHKAVVRGMAWLSVFVLAAKGVAALKEIAVAYRFGTGEVLEGYLLVYNLASWPVSLLFSVMHFVLVPALVRQQRAPDGGHAWQRQVTAWVWLAALAVGGLVAVLLPPLIRSGWLGLTLVGREAALTAVQWLAPAAALGVLASWHACQLMSRQRHVNTFLEAMPAMGILVAVLLVPMATVDGLLWGTLAGFLAQWVLLVFIVRLGRLPVVPVANTAWPLDRALGENAGWLLAAQGLMGVGGVIDQIILAHLPAGALATFGYANRVMALVLTLTATVVDRALLPVLAGLSADDARAVARRWAGWALMVGVLCAVALAYCSEVLIQLLFERGAFTLQNSIDVVSVLNILGLQLPAYMAGIVWQKLALSTVAVGRRMWWIAVFSLIIKLCAIKLALLADLPAAEAVAVGQTSLIFAWCLMTWRMVSRPSGNEF